MIDSDGASDGDADASTNTAASAETNAEETQTATDGDGSEDPLSVGVVTIAADRTLDADAAGKAIETALEEKGYSLATREHVASSHDRVQSIVLRVIEREDVDVVITAGGASVEPDDIVIEAVAPLLDKELDAFGDLFTALGYEAVGTRVLAARTLAGVADETPVFCLPGNADAARLGTEDIILPEAGYLVDLARADDTDGSESDE